MSVANAKENQAFGRSSAFRRRRCFRCGCPALCFANDSGGALSELERRIAKLKQQVKQGAASSEEITS